MLDAQVVRMPAWGKALTCMVTCTVLISWLARGLRFKRMDIMLDAGKVFTIAPEAFIMYTGSNRTAVDILNAGKSSSGGAMLITTLGTTQPFRWV